MFKSIWLIMKKECSRFLKDRRMLLMAIVLPAVLMYGVYSLMGIGMKNQSTVAEDYVFQCAVQAAPEAFDPMFEAMNFEVIPTRDLEAAKQSVSDKEVDLLVIFPGDFEETFMNEDAAVPNIQVYYNYDSVTSQAAYTLFTAGVEELETSIVNVLDVNRDVENPDLAESDSWLLAFIPVIVVMMLFSSCASLAPESVAGEKERGTFATLLVTPVNRTAIAVGKIISLSLFAILAGLSNFAGMFLGMKNMLDGNTEGIIPAYGMTEYVLLLALIVTTVLMIISVVSVLSAYAKTVKEAAASVGMITTIGSLGSFMITFGANFSGIGWRCVPVLGTALGLNDVFMMEYSVVDVAVTCVSNLAVMAVLVFLLSKMFNSEKIMFNK